MTENKIVSLLRQGGYKLTPQRRQVITAIASSHEHLTPAALYDRIHNEHPHIGKVTIYRTLEILSQLGLICEMHTEGNCRSYLLRRPTGHHHHLVCSSCGTVEDFTDCDISTITARLAQKTGFDISSHLLEFSGICPHCQQTTGNQKA